MQRATRGEIRIAMGEPNRCITGKPTYDKKGAITARNLRMKEDHIELRIYECPDCGRWHLTKQLRRNFFRKNAHKKLR